MRVNPIGCTRDVELDRDDCAEVLEFHLSPHSLFTGVLISFYQCPYQRGHPVYAPQLARFEVIHDKQPLFESSWFVCQSRPEPHFLPCVPVTVLCHHQTTLLTAQLMADDCSAAPCSLSYSMQQYRGPPLHPVHIGRGSATLRITLRGKVQAQASDSLQYVCVRWIGAVGGPSHRYSTLAANAHYSTRSSATIRTSSEIRSFHWDWNLRGLAVECTQEIEKISRFIQSYEADWNQMKRAIVVVASTIGKSFSLDAGSATAHSAMSEFARQHLLRKFLCRLEAPWLELRRRALDTFAARGVRTCAELLVTPPNAPRMIYLKALAAQSQLTDDETLLLCL